MFSQMLTRKSGRIIRSRLNSTIPRRNMYNLLTKSQQQLKSYTINKNHLKSTPMTYSIISIKELLQYMKPYNTICKNNIKSLYKNFQNLLPPLGLYPLVYAAVPFRGLNIPQFNDGQHGGSNQEDQIDVVQYRKAYEDLVKQQESDDQTMMEFLTNAQTNYATITGEHALSSEQLAQVDIDDPTTWPESLRVSLESLTDTYERLRSDSESLEWCREYLKDIYRFSNENTMEQDFHLRLGTNLFKNMIRYKTYIEKERFKLYLHRDNIIDMQRQLAINVDSILSLLNDANPEDSVTGERYTSPAMKPIYNSLISSLATSLEVGAVFGAFFEMFKSTDSLVAKTLKEGKNEEAYKIIRDQANMVEQTLAGAENLAKYIDQTLSRFENYYTTVNVDRLVQYAQIESMPHRRKQLDNIHLPPPPVLDLSPQSVEQILGFTGDIQEHILYEPVSKGFVGIQHLSPRERLEKLSFPDIYQSLTPAQNRQRALYASKDLLKIGQRYPQLSDKIQDQWIDQSIKHNVYGLDQNEPLPPEIAKSFIHNPEPYIKKLYNQIKKPEDLPYGNYSVEDDNNYDLISEFLTLEDDDDN